MSIFSAPVDTLLPHYCNDSAFGEGILPNRNSHSLLRPAKQPVLFESAPLNSEQ